MNENQSTGAAGFHVRSPRYRVPGSTYRLQFNSDFSFRDALEISAYLHELGITDCYASPVLAARPGSTHGYDVCNCAELNPSVGTQKEFDRWAARLQELGMGLLLDIVPNHMGADLTNPWWRDVLEHGEGSKFARWFDIDWHPPDERLQGKVLLPILEAPYWKVLEAGKLRIALLRDRFSLVYHQFALPLSPESLTTLQQEILRLCRDEARETESLADLSALGEVAARLNSLKRAADLGPYQASLPDHPGLQSGAREGSALERALERFNGTVGSAGSFDALHALLQQQHYRLAFWRIGNQELNYRRFFDVTELVALRTELPEVFQATHELVLRLVQQHKVTGLRVDHPDGLWDPRQYFQRLQESALDGEGRRPHAGPECEESNSAEWIEPRSALQSPDPGAAKLYVVAEKILSGRETLPADWPVAGTTGYDFLNQLNGLFVNGSNREALDELYLAFSGAGPDFKSLVYAAKLKILQEGLRTDLEALSGLLRFIAGRTRYGMDFSSSELHDALSSTIAAFPVYRTYLTEESEAPAPKERPLIEQAIETASLASRGCCREVFSFLQSLLLLSPPEDLDEAGSRACRQFVMKFQQLTGPVMAKGLEDTAFYRYNRLISLNEVGGAPDCFGTDLDSFHEQNRARVEHGPHSLLTTATHDTKRGEDLRARVNVLSEIPEEWRQAVLKWSRLNAQHKTGVEGELAPDANDEYLLYQTLVGAWGNEAEPGGGSEGFQQRICDYMVKAVREAKAHTSWIQPNPVYEQATRHFIEATLTHSPSNLFLDDFMLFHRKIAFFGLFNSLAQVVLKLTAPGIPDFYQGTELWDYSLVDPDNRHPVDYRTRKMLISDLRQKLSDAHGDVSAVVKLLLKNYHSGQIKLYLIWRLLELRRRRRRCFDQGSYLPIPARGPKRAHLCAFAREYAGESIITVAARWILGLTNGAQRGALEPDVWQDTTLPVPGGNPGDSYKNVLTQQIVELRRDGGGLPIPEVLGLLPVAVLERVT